MIIKSNYKYNFISIPILLDFLFYWFFSIIGFNYVSNETVNFIPTLSIYLLQQRVKILRSIQAIGGEENRLILYELMNSSKNDIKFENYDDIKKVDFKKSIKLENLYFGYKNKKILNNFNLEIKKNDIIGIIGKSGSGKTTLINIIMGLLSPEKGEIFVDNVSISKNIRGWQKNISLVQQDNVILDDTIKNNIILGSDLKRLIIQGI